MPRLGWSPTDSACWVHFERSTPTSSDVAEETTFWASAGSLEEDTRRSITVKVRSRARGRSEACEGANQCSGQDGSRHLDGRSPRACSRLEKALTAWGDFDAVFIERAKKRIARIDEERQAEVRSVEEAEHKLTQLRALNTTQQEQPVGPTVADSGAEIQGKVQVH